VGGHLEVERVSVTYAGRRAVDDVSFEMRPGEKLLVVGPSGCGKSTLLSAVAAFVPPSRGQIRLDGQAVTRPGPDRVVVFQEFDQLLPWRTVLDNVAYPLRIARKLGRVEAIERGWRFVEMVGLSGFADAYPHTLSGGMKQRVAIARALALEPSVLLMDEPFASLDALTRTRMQAELNAIWNATRCSILFVTHSIQEAVLLGSRILVLSPGPGTIRAVLDNEAHGQPADSPASATMQARIGALLDAQGA
jgi:NitT/TauT family transport system ATP-binding protein